MLYKYKQNITFNVINTQIHKKVKSTKKQGVGHFSIIVFWTLGNFSTWVNILSDTGFWILSVWG